MEKIKMKKNMYNMIYFWWKFFVRIWICVYLLLCDIEKIWNDINIVNKIIFKIKRCGWRIKGKKREKLIKIKRKENKGGKEWEGERVCERKEK